MMTGAAKRIFVDTNVLVYSAIPGAPLHQAAGQAIQRETAAKNELWISRQVIREFVAALTRPQPFSAAFPVVEVIGRVRLIQEVCDIADEDFRVTNHLIALIQQVPTGGKHVHDANIVATMLANNISHLLTHNTTDFTRYQPLITVIPL